ncbi:MAG: hypothetical protein AAFX03_07360 [Pseudomonadota bacterium]
MRRAALLAVLTLSSAASARESAPPATLDSFLWDSADYLAAGEPDPYTIDHRQQFAGVLGREDLIQAERDFMLETRVGGVCGESVGAPLDMLLGAAAKTRIVILNDAHMMPLHRADTLGLIEALTDRGFTHFAYESFEESVMARGDEAFVREADVFYTRDPAGAALVRRLKAKGVQLVAYEGADHPDGREAAQAANLARLLDNDPDARLIVVAGHAHVFEHVDGWAGQMMARRLKDLTGLDPLTISQTACRSSTGEVVLTRSKRGADGVVEIGETDYALGHPPLTFTAKRPDWRRAWGGVDTPVPEVFLGLDEPVILDARRLGAPDVAAPDDRLLVLPGETGIPLILEPGQYEVRGHAKNGPVAGPVLITVDAD